MHRIHRVRQLTLVASGLLLLAIAGCKTTRSSGGGFDTYCQLAVSPDRQAIAFLTEEALIRRIGTDEVRLPFADHVCLKQGRTTDKLALSSGGRFAVVLGEEAQGFNLHESVPFESTVCCLVDFVGPGVRDLCAIAPQAGLADQVRHRKILMSPGLQVMLTWDGSGAGPQVIDLAAGRAARLDLQTSRGCDYVETGRRGILACPGFAQLDTGGYEHFVMVTAIDFGQWPPAASETRTIRVAASLNGVALSRDGKLLAYWGYDFGKLGDYTGLMGVRELTSGATRFERRETRYGFVTSMEFAPDGSSVLVGESLMDGGGRRKKIGTNERGQVVRLDLSGKALGAQAVSKPPQRLFWMKDGILCDLGCRGVWLKH